MSDPSVSPQPALGISSPRRLAPPLCGRRARTPTQEYKSSPRSFRLAVRGGERFGLQWQKAATLRHLTGDKVRLRAAVRGAYTLAGWRCRGLWQLAQSWSNLGI